MAILYLALSAPEDAPGARRRHQSGKPESRRIERRGAAGWLLPNEVRNRYTERSPAHDHTLFAATPEAVEVPLELHAESERVPLGLTLGLGLRSGPQAFGFLLSALCVLEALLEALGAPMDLGAGAPVGPVRSMKRVPTGSSPHRASSVEGLHPLRLLVLPPGARGMPAPIVTANPSCTPVRPVGRA